MDGFLMLAVAIGLAYFFTSLALTKELLMWEPKLVKRLLLTLVIWSLPFIGALIAYKYLNLAWFKDRKKSAANAHAGMSGALLEIDSIFNPGQKHVIEQKQKENIELTESVSQPRKE